MFYIRADANEVIATGHMMRCLSIADAIRQLGEDVTFFVADEKGRELAEGRGYSTICLNSVWNCMESELETLISCIGVYHVRTLLVDSYQVTERYLAQLREHVRIIYIDDLDAFAYPCNQIINYAVYAKECSYAKDAGNLLGTCYMPLRQAFWDMPKHAVKKELKQLLVLTGGADEHRFLRRFLDGYLAWGQANTLSLTIISGRFQKDYDELMRLVSDRKNIVLKKNVANMEWYMQQADMAISAGGTTLYELCACGTPTISYALADNQMKNVLTFDKIGLIPYCGDIRDENCVPRMLEYIGRWWCDGAERERRAKKMQCLVDGRGAMRLAQELVTLA